VGWQEFEDAVIGPSHGLELLISPTRTEAASIVGGVQSLVLVAVADRALSPDQPGDEEADRVWRAKLTDFRASMWTTGRTRWQRIRAAISRCDPVDIVSRELFRR
jgi:hypothetical protein